MADQTVPPDADDDNAPVEHSEPKLREPTEYEKRLRRESARYRETARTETAERQRLAAELETVRSQSASERDAALAALRGENETALNTVRTEAQQRLIRSELKAYAIQAGIVDLDGLRLADLSGVTLNEAGEVEGADALIAALRDSKPYLFAEVVKPGTVTGTTSSTQPAPRPAGAQPFDARTASREDWLREKKARGHH